MTERKTRTLELEQHVDATPEEVWEILTTGDGLSRWFPLDARVTPGVDGTVWLSWGPGCEGEAPIHVWEPGSHFGWTEDHGQDAEGRAIKVAVDFHIEGRHGDTVVRLVQSGFDASADWDEMYDALRDGWSYFLFNLAHYFQHHRGRPRRLAWKRAPTDLSRDGVWRRLVDQGLVAEESREPAAEGAPDALPVLIDRLRPAHTVSRREGHHFAAVLPDLEQALFFVEIEGRHVGFWLSTYGTESTEVERLQAALEERIEVALGAG
jgi:uncharacterized protein YndB with AHSA1/START domain